jgi:hypothetical protein
MAFTTGITKDIDFPRQVSTSSAPASRKACAQPAAIEGSLAILATSPTFPANRPFKADID